MLELQVLKSVNGIPVPMQPNENLDFGKYYMGKGATLEFFLKNNSDNSIVNISDIHTEEPNAVFHGPKTIDPTETVKVSIKVKPSTGEDVDNYITDKVEKDLPPDNFHLIGKYEWSNFHSRFEQ